MFLRGLKLIVTSTIFLYALCFLCVWKFLDYPKMSGNAVAQTMSRYVPPIMYFKDFVQKKDDYDEFKLRWCIDYHQKVSQFFDYQKSEAFGMMAFCYERLGEPSKAFHFYQESAQANSEYLWPYYNMGVLSFKKHEYEKAIPYFEQALSKDVKKNMILLLQSKVYADVRLSDNPKYDLLQSLREGSLNSYIYLLESLNQLKRYQQMFELSLLGLKENLGQEDIFYYYAGLGAFHQNAFDKASELLQESLQKNPQNPEVLFYMGQSLHMLGRDDMAQEFLSKAVDVRQKNGSPIEKLLSERVKFF